MVERGTLAQLFRRPANGPIQNAKKNVRDRLIDKPQLPRHVSAVLFPRYRSDLRCQVLCEVSEGCRELGGLMSGERKARLRERGEDIQDATTCAIPTTD